MPEIQLDEADNVRVHREDIYFRFDSKIFVSNDCKQPISQDALTQHANFIPFPLFDAVQVI